MSEPEKMGRRSDGEEMGGLFNIVPQIEAVIEKINTVVAAVDPTKIRDFLDAIRVDDNTITIDVKLVLRKTEAP